MPGTRIVLKAGEEDPDPSPYLFVSNEQRIKNSEKPYDPKRSCWVPDSEEKFLEGLIQETTGGKVKVQLNKNKEVIEFKQDQVAQVNPPKFDMCDDMSNLTYLNDASVLFNLKARYVEKLIYTYSGLFCIAVNPYKRFPIYTRRTVDIYRMKRRNEVPPHIFGIAEGSYHSMCMKNKNQSILITGESGAGKTENTKKVITYFAFVGSTAGSKKDKSGAKKVSLEDQVVQTNPVLEAFGNAKTVRNDNSSRFGKFIRVWFNNQGKMAGGDIETYLLEKSRVTYQSPMERSYHIFYFMITHQVDLRESCMLSEDIFEYPLMSMGKVFVESIDDKEEMSIMDEAFDILGFTQEEKYDVYKVSSLCMHLSKLEFNGHGEITTAKNLDAGTDILSLFNWCDSADELYDRFCNPKIKVGMEWVNKSQNLTNVMVGVGSIIKNIFGRLFRYLVDMCNNTLIDPTMKKVNYIGVLDIAGFEIFDFNTLEQLMINFVNEKLQQFFNHNMFVLEQEEYMREGIEWVSVDFGMDLAACIDLFEKPMGILPILEEETIYPKASDKTFEEKLKSTHLGKHNNFARACSKTDKDAHFAIIHYAGTVSYNVTGWLDKNRDPINDTVIDLFKKSKSCNLMSEIYADHPGQTKEEDDAPTPGHRRGKKRVAVKSKTAAKMANFKTVCSYFKDQLNNLINMLMSTEPSFIRCIVPNGIKTPGLVDPFLVMHQLTCNGVLEGIRICTKGFPNRVMYADFRQRYAILAPKEAHKAMKMVKRPVTEDKKNIAATHAVMDKTPLTLAQFQYGHTKIFFRAGVLGQMEEMRDDRVNGLITFLQSWMRGYHTKKVYKKLWEHKRGLLCIQRTIRNYMMGQKWQWWQIWLALKPNLKSGRFEDFKKELAERIIYAQEHLDEVKRQREVSESKNKSLTKDLDEIRLSISGGTNAKQDILDKIARAEEITGDYHKEILAIKQRVTSEHESCESLSQSLKKIESNQSGLTRELKEYEMKLNSVQNQKADKEMQIKQMKDEISHQEEIVNKLNREKKNVIEARQKEEEKIQSIEDRSNHLSKLKFRLEKQLDEIEDTWEREKKHRNDIEKQKRVIEGNLKLTQEAVSDLERINLELNQVVQRKEKELGSLNGKIEDEQTLGSKINLQIKELNIRLEELDEDLEAERLARARADKAKCNLKRELEELHEKLEETGSNTTAQIALNTRREEELSKLKSELEESNISHESTLAVLRQKHNSSITDMADNMDQLNKQKAMVEKERNNIMQELESITLQLQAEQSEKTSLEKSGKLIQNSTNELSVRLEEKQRALHEADGTKRKLMIENCDLVHHLEEGERLCASLNKDKTSFTTQLEDAKRLADAETRERINLLGKMRNLEHELIIIKEHLDQEFDSKQEVERQLSKAFADVQLWKTRFETEGVARIEEIERDRSKISSRLREAEDTISALQEKIAVLEKSKSRMSTESEDLTSECDRQNTNASIIEKRGRNFDKVINEWKCKAEDLSSEITASQSECRNFSSEYFRIKSSNDEIQEHLDTVKRENKNLADEIKDLMDQLGEGGRSIHDLDKTRRKLEIEKEELQAALEEAEATLEQEENKVLRTQLEMSQVRQEIDRRIREKEEEFDHHKKNHLRCMDSMQASLEAETRAKEEILRIKKKLESDINEMEIALDHANKAHNEARKATKRTQAQLADINSAIEEERKICNEVEEQLGLAERKSNALFGELEESKALLEASKRGQNQVEQELCDSKEQTSDLQMSNQALLNNKRKLESDIHQIQADIDNLLCQSKAAEEKAKRAMVDAGRLADELRAEQDHTCTQDKIIRVTDKNLSDLALKAEEASAHASNAAINVPAKLESRIRDIETELNKTILMTAECHKYVTKGERRVKELGFQTDENKKNQDRMADLVDKLQQKIHSYKKQIEEAEEIAAINLAKYRKVQQDMEEAEERTKIASEQVHRIKNARCASVKPSDF
uniref:Myosin heavy chain 1 [Tribolium castaneum] n=1 Tax=Lepeophtheirus salmonis TaxID=72036 RepID=A0A0K2T980_LEPSM